MPFTPLHLGLGGAAGGYTSSWLSFRAFCFANVLIDMEALYRLPLMLDPVHDWLHTFLLGGLLPLVLWFPVGKPLCLFVSRQWNERAIGGCLEHVRIPTEIRLLPAVVGLIFGGLSHVFLDSIMHTDIAPLRPFSPSNPFFNLVNLSHLHYMLAAGGLLGIALLFFRCRKKGE